MHTRRRFRRSSLTAATAVLWISLAPQVVLANAPIAAATPLLSESVMEGAMRGALIGAAIGAVVGGIAWAVKKSKQK